MIDMSYMTKKIPGTTTFRWHEALYLPQWDICVIPTEKQYLRILKAAQKIQKARDLVGFPFMVTNWVRTIRYNKLIGGAVGSCHLEGGAVDFQVLELSADLVKEKLKPHLETLRLRMENNPGSSWIHLDDREPGESGRFFTP